jgi:hypothetical protein
MQTSIQVFSKGTKSLRDKIVNDSRLADFGLTVSEEKRATRSPGWSKIHMENAAGAINLEWHAASQTLICRIVTRKSNPYQIAGTFISFLLARFSKQIVSIRVCP